MIGRGVFKNPFAFEKEPREHSPQEHIGAAEISPGSV